MITADQRLKYGYYNDIDEIRTKYLKSKKWNKALIHAFFKCDLETQTEIIQTEIIKDLMKSKGDMAK